MKYKKRLSIAVFLLLLIPIVLNTLALFLRMADREESLKNEFLQSTTSQLQHTMDYFIKRLQTDLIYLSFRPELQDLAQWYEESDFREKRNFFRNLDPFNRLSDFYDEAYLVHPPDDLMLDLKNKFVTPIENSALEETVHYLNALLESYQGEKDVLFSIGDGDESVTYLIRSVRNTVTGNYFYIYVRLNDYFFKSLLEEIFMIDRSFVVVGNQDGQAVVMRVKDLSLDVSELPALGDLLSAGDSPVRLGGERYLVAGAKSEETGWLYIHGVGYSEIRRDLLSHLFNTGLMTAGFVLVFALVSLQLSKVLYRPIESLMDSLDSSGNQPDADEFSQIQRYISNLAEKNRILDKTIADSGPYRKEALLKSLLRETSGSPGDDMVPDTLGPVLTPGSGDRFLVIETLLRYLPDFSAYANRDLLLLEEDETISRWFRFAPDVQYETMLVDNDTLVFICRIPGAGADFLISEHLEIDPELRDSVYLGCSTLKDGLGELAAAYKEARIAVEYRTILPDSTFILYREVMDSRSQLHFYPFTEESRIINAVKQRDAESARDHQVHFFSILSATGLPFHQLKHAAFHLMDSYLRVLKEFDLTLDGDTIGRMAAVADGLEDTIDPADIRSRLDDLLETVLAIMDDNQSSASLVIAESVKHIVDQRYSDRNLSLDMLSDEVKYSVSHISAIFKTTYGETIKQYITNVRLAKAKELLLTTNLKIESIGRETGYENVGSFVKIFKAYIGETPKNYRLRNNEANSS